MARMQRWVRNPNDLVKRVVPELIGNTEAGGKPESISVARNPCRDGMIVTEPPNQGVDFFRPTAHDLGSAMREE
jgi:hypothetical protein